MLWFLHVCKVKDLVSSVLKQYGRIDFLVNNGGGQFSSPAEHISSKGWKAVIDTNLTGTFQCCQAGMMHTMNTNGMFCETDSILLNTHSLFLMDETAWRCDCEHHRWYVERLSWNEVGKASSHLTHTLIFCLLNPVHPFHASHTGAARAAVDNLTKSLAIEWAASGVRVNAIAPVSKDWVFIDINIVRLPCQMCVFIRFAGYNLFKNCNGELQGSWASALQDVSFTLPC